LPRDSEVWLDDILAAAEKIARYLDGLDRAAFSRDEKTADAVIRNLEIIGEATKQVPPDVRARAPEIDWQKVAGLRDVLIHAYFGVDLDIVWEVATAKVPPLAASVLRLRSGRHG
jgi:uncharacterized protein with HEPN domain